MLYDWQNMTESQKVKATKWEVEKVTHNATTKDDLLNIIRWLWDKFEVENVNQGKANIGEYNPDADCYYLQCDKCKETIGSLENEDADGEYKYNIFGNYCPNCGQKIVQEYTEEDYKRWGV